jgi:hypothetical protein
MEPQNKPVEKLEALKRRLKEERKSFRLAKYDIFAETMGSVVELRSDDAALKAFVKKADIDPEKIEDTDRSWITTAAFTFVTHNEQQGWKAGRVAEFLHDKKKVPVGQLAEAIREGGGIEKIVRVAAEEDPRRPKR